MEKQIEVRVMVSVDPHSVSKNVSLEILHVSFSHMFYDSFPQIIDKIAEKLAVELLEDARLKILGTDEAKNAIFNEVTAKLINRLAFLENKIEENKEESK